MMNKTAAVVVMASLSFAALHAGDADVVKGLQNLSGVHRIANVLELRRTLAHSLPLQVPPDPWGTPYTIDVTSGKSGKIVWICDTGIDKDPTPSAILAN